MSNIQTGAERMPHDLSHLGFLAGQIGRLITISTTPVIAGDSFEMDAVRSEERRVGKECRSRWWREHLKQIRGRAHAEVSFKLRDVLLRLQGEPVLHVLIAGVHAADRRG